MKRVWVDTSSLIGQVLLQVLPCTSMRIVESPNQPDTILLDMDKDHRKHQHLFIDSKIPVVSMSFLSPKFARLNAKDLGDREAVCFIQKPFMLHELRAAIDAAPKDFLPVFSHPGINLYYYLKMSLQAPPCDVNSEALRQQTAMLFPELFKRCGEDLLQFMNLLPFQILFSIYSGLAHCSGQDGLIGVLSTLRGNARDCLDFPSDNWPKDALAKASSNFLRSPEREAFHFHSRHIENLLRIVEEPHKMLVSSFLSDHQKIAEQLKQIETHITRDKIDCVSAYATIDKLGYKTYHDLAALFNRKESLKGENHERFAD